MEVENDFVFIHTLQSRKHNYHVGRSCGRNAVNGERIDVRLDPSSRSKISLKEENLTSFKLRKEALSYGVFDLNSVSESLRAFIKVSAIVKCILEYLSVELGSREDCTHVFACGPPLQANHPYDFTPKSALQPGTETCWISSSVGFQPFDNAWIAFTFKNVIRVESFAVRIPRLPGGPLAVRVFYLEGSMNGESWERCSCDLTTLDTNGLQQFCVSPPAEFQHIRMRCLESADPNSDKVGLWEVQFNTAAL